MIEPADHTKKRNWVETILRYVPGFRGYLEKEYRRESDNLQREWLAGRLERGKRAIDNLMGLLAEGGHVDQLAKLDQVRSRIDHLIARVRGAMEGYSGFFDLVKIDEAVLDRVYEYDVSLAEKVEGLAAAIERLPKCPSDLSCAIDEVVASLEEFHRLWDAREEILTGLR
ncbi:hypothetical protein [Thermogutta sp.]|uniref:hypothetical protein n=1 Tax=Thermogutta sp. TaxID=1962930 RepID=UPI00321FD9B1